MTVDCLGPHIDNVAVNPSRHVTLGQPPPPSPNQIHHHMNSQLWGRGGSTACPLANYQGTDDDQHIKAIGNALTTRLSRDENKC